MCVGTYLCACMYPCVCRHVFVHVSVCVGTCLYVSVSKHVFVYVRMYLCVCRHVFVCAHLHMRLYQRGQTEGLRNHAVWIAKLVPALVHDVTVGRSSKPSVPQLRSL